MCWTHPSIWVQTRPFLVFGCFGVLVPFDSLMFQVLRFVDIKASGLPPLQHRLLIRLRPCGCV
ncbi:hypothetical protein A2U01_0080198, partial [Trifolium medium]|nr:hypothetical protein [Trifolium medium]